MCPIAGVILRSLGLTLAPVANTKPIICATVRVHFVANADIYRPNVNIESLPDSIIDVLGHLALPFSPLLLHLVSCASSITHYMGHGTHG